MMTEVSGAEEAAAKEVGDIDGRGVEGKIALRFAASLDQ